MTNKITHSDYKFVAELLENTLDMEGLVVMELIDDTTGKRSILLKERKYE